MGKTKVKVKAKAKPKKKPIKPKMGKGTGGIIPVSLIAKLDKDINNNG